MVYTVPWGLFLHRAVGGFLPACWCPTRRRGAEVALVPSEAKNVRGTRREAAEAQKKLLIIEESSKLGSRRFRKGGEIQRNHRYLSLTLSVIEQHVDER